MIDFIERLKLTMQYAIEHSPKNSFFPFLAECLRLTGVTKNIWTLPSAQSVYIMRDGAVVQQDKTLKNGISSIPPFNEQKLIAAIRSDQEGKTTFIEFLISSWEAGVIRYEVDFTQRKVDYYGIQGEVYSELYKSVTIENFPIEFIAS